MFNNSTGSPSQVKGLFYEKLAHKHLSRNGLKIVQKNYHCRFGEIDLILKDADTIVFAEVRYRSKTSHGGALETITKLKQKRLIKSAQVFLLENNLYERVAFRFDAVCIQGQNTKPEITWIKNAF